MMALELIGGRLLQPVFGSSIDVWAAIISVFILSLSIGYVVGGRLADRSPSNRLLGTVIFAAALFFLLLPVYARPFLDFLSPQVQAARSGVLLAALILFLPPSILLGCVSPMLIKLAFSGAHRVGETSGTVYAVGSFGNVLGVLVADYFLLAHFRLNDSILAMGCLLGIIGLGHLIWRVQPDSRAAAAASQTTEGGFAASTLLISLSLLAGTGWLGMTFQDDPYRVRGVAYSADEQVLEHRDSVYAHISWVVSEGDNSAQMRFFNTSQGAICLEPTWPELSGLDPALKFLAMPADFKIDPNKPNPGTLANAQYVMLYPISVLLNDPLIERAGGNWRKAAPFLW